MASPFPPSHRADVRGGAYGSHRRRRLAAQRRRAAGTHGRRLSGFEWSIHVAILHWRPRSLGRFAVDPLLARKHREHHCDPRQIELIFIPWQTLVWVIPTAVAIALMAFPRLGLGLTYLISLTALGLAYEWTHYLIHSDYKAKTVLYQAIWRNHRRHHFKNEHYWFTVTSSGTADRLLGTYPNQSTVPTSPTAKNLHGATR